MTGTDYIAEEAVLGSMLREPELVGEILSVVRPNDFLDDAGRRFFEAARALFREGAPVDPVTVLGKLGLDHDQAARNRAAKWMNETPTTANWREYAAIMHERAVLTRMQAEAVRIANANTLDECREPLAAINAELHAGHGVRCRRLNELLSEFAERQSPEHAQKPRYLTGFPKLDHLAKLTGGKFCIIAGLPSDGKTALALQWALGFAKTAPVGVFSLETDAETLVDRFVTHGFGIDYDHIVDQRLTDLDWVSFAEKLPLYAQRNLAVFDESSMTADEIAAVSTAYGFKVVFVDYGQLIETDRERGVTRAELLARVSQSLKRFARSTDTLVILLLQLKQPETYKVRTGMGVITRRKSPTMEDIGETRQFEKDADVIFLLYRPERGGTDDEENPYIEQLNYDRHRILKLAKNKEGRRGSLTLYFDGLHQTFYINGQEPEARRPGSRGKRPAGNPGQRTFDDVPEEEGAPF